MKEVQLNYKKFLIVIGINIAMVVIFHQILVNNPINSINVWGLLTFLTVGGILDIIVFYSRIGEKSN